MKADEFDLGNVTDVELVEEACGTMRGEIGHNGDKFELVFYKDHSGILLLSVDGTQYARAFYNMETKTRCLDCVSAKLYDDTIHEC